jgi:hypothetical protein
VVCLTLALASSGAAAGSSDVQTKDPRDDLSPWGVASGAEWFSAYPIFNPLLRQAGVRWLRGFYEWQLIQPVPGAWNFALPDNLVKNARSNGIHLVGVLAYLTPWASADGGTRKFPIKNIAYWRDYVSGMVGRYHSDIKYWEVWNEFNGSFAEGGTPATYAELVREASVAAKKIDSEAKIGLSVANFDVNFLDAAIKAGAANHFDYICVHPYELLGRLADGGEPAFLNMTTTLRKMLEANHQPKDVPLWITEIGAMTSVEADESLDRAQAAQLAKAFVLSLAAGFERVFWFEARGPSYSHGSRDFGLIRANMTPRPAYAALKTLTSVLGAEPKSDGWLDLGGDGFGFLFDTGGPVVLAAWAPPRREISVTFDSDVWLTNLSGETTLAPAGKPVRLTDTPVLITGLPAVLVEKAKAQKNKPYPWMANLSDARSVSATLNDTNVQNGIRQIRADTTIASPEWRRPDFSRSDKEGHYVYFSVDPQFASFGTGPLEITALVRRTAPDKIAGMSVDYESNRGYVNSEYRNIPEGDDWQELSWTVPDANFVGAWGWNFRLNAIGSPNEFLIREVRVRRVQ